MSQKSNAEIKALVDNVVKDLKLDPLALTRENDPIFHLERWMETTSNIDDRLDGDQLLNSHKHHGFNMHEKVPKEAETGNTLNGVTLIEPLQLFNLMMGTDQHQYPCIADPNYLLLIDARRRETYDQSHIQLAKFAVKTSSGEYEIPANADIETKLHIVVYDNRTEILKIDGKNVKTEATVLAKRLYSTGTRHPVKILRGGYILFSRYYPFLRTDQIIYLPSDLDVYQTYPLEVLPRKLYLATWQQCNNPMIQNHLKLTGYINCVDNSPRLDARDLSTIVEVDVQSVNPLVLNVNCENRGGEKWRLVAEDIKHFTSFIDSQEAVVITSPYRMNKAAAICIAYLMANVSCTLKVAMKYCQEHHISVLPDADLLRHLCTYESVLKGETQTKLLL